MFDFRYHALSLVAVFLALAIGLLLGVVIGDAGLVSTAKRDIEKSLRGDVREARAESDKLTKDLAQHVRFENEVYPLLVGGQLEGKNIGLVFFGTASDTTASQVRDALSASGGRLRVVAGVREPLDLAGLAGRAKGTRYTALPADPELAKMLGVRMGVQFVAGGKLIQQVRPELFKLTGTLGKLDAVAIARDVNTFENETQRAAAEAFEAGFAAGVEKAGVPAVGIESTKAAASQIAWYRDHELASVDDVDQIAGKASLVFTLAGADGSYGVKGTAQALLPPVVGGVVQP
jgi:Copper transport outer membrane protein, MctB